MALETVVFQQDPYCYGLKDFYNIWGVESYGLAGGVEKEIVKHEEQGSNGICWDTRINSSPDCSGNGSFDMTRADFPAAAPTVMPCRRKRRRTKSCKNKKETENQRLTHIAVERNRRRQMNDYLAILRSLMPPSYAQRGDQASIVGGAINFVKELEQLLQFLEEHKKVKLQRSSPRPRRPFIDFFTFPQYSTFPICHKNSMSSENGMSEKGSSVAVIEVTMAESHANIKISTRTRPKQLLTLVTGFYSLSLTILHLNITTIDQMVLYSFSAKVEDDSHLTSANDIATAVHELVGMIQQEAARSC